MATLDTSVTTESSTRRYRFGVFEADASTGELWRKGMRVRIAAQPMQVLLLLLERPGTVLGREEIAKSLWPNGTFVDFDHGVNSAVNRIREALGDTAANPRFVETLAKRGYRFMASVELVGNVAVSTKSVPDFAASADQDEAYQDAVEPEVTASLLATQDTLPVGSRGMARGLFLALQVTYFAFYVGLLFNLREVNEMLADLPHAEECFGVAVSTAAILIPARAYLISALMFRAPRMLGRYLRLWPFLLVFDVLWALSPFLLLHHISFGVALVCVALLVYSPFAQRSLALMGAFENNAS